jgi:CHAT domain-containing protein
VNGIADLFKKRGLPAVTLLGSDAKKAALQSKDLSKYRYIHFATHALSSGDLPYLSEPSLVLSFDQNSDDAFFTWTISWR